MQIKIEIDVKPEELRRFLGLPDVAGLQEDLVNFLRDKLGAAAETLDPSSFVKDNIQSLKQSAPWQLLVSATKSSSAAVAPEQKTPARRSRKGGTATKSTRRRKSASRKKSAAPSVDGNTTE